MFDKYINKDLRGYTKFLNNTGGNDPEDLLRRLNEESNLMFSNAVVGTLAMAVESQMVLLRTLKDEGYLLEKPIGQFMNLDEQKLKETKIEGAIEALKLFAVWKDGVQYVNDMRTLEEAIEAYKKSKM